MSVPTTDSEHVGASWRPMTLKYPSWTYDLQTSVNSARKEPRQESPLVAQSYCHLIQCLVAVWLP
ncbi:hypothetical protein ARMSODRAFT_965508 [Armillaria solidipes]|uniref:Uncharacterized protein n=1 Tax=Armillaria solidipes TaxID=1076256 RepID=A0A2H3AVV7_9AGAR|nr:hypothetical protein ARMSODRAFT_965508 [Armillaria solidipes]